MIWQPFMNNERSHSCIFQQKLHTHSDNERASERARSITVLLSASFSAYARPLQRAEKAFCSKRANLRGYFRSSKRGLDFGMSRGFSGSQTAKHLLGLAAASYAGGPGRRKRATVN